MSLLSYISVYLENMLHMAKCILDSLFLQWNCYRPDTGHLYTEPVRGISERVLIWTSEKTMNEKGSHVLPSFASIATGKPKYYNVGESKLSLEWGTHGLYIIDLLLSEFNISVHFTSIINHKTHFPT